jgi:hypothetical protein
VILRTSRFFPEADDSDDIRRAYEDRNVKANEFLYRRADIEDVVSAHFLAMEKSTGAWLRPLHRQRYHALCARRSGRAASNAPSVVQRRVPAYEEEYARRDWKMFPTIDRVYVNERAAALRFSSCAEVSARG